jgi:hypothetical protein
MDFEKLLNEPAPVEKFDLEELFNSLDVKSSHTELRQAQKEALIELTKRNTSKDLVLKISTGAGKTTVGLLFLFAHMKLTQRPVVFLCPTVQLVEQTLSEAARLGIPASHYASGESHPGADALHGKEIIVCTYEKLFNAKSTFNRQDVALSPVAFVLDDTHAGVEIIRKCYTLKLSGESFEVLKKILNDACSEQEPHKWINILQGMPYENMEVPFWVWKAKSQKILEKLNAFRDSDNFMFVWPLISGILPMCRCVISGSGAEIVPDILPVDDVRAFQQAEYRLFMSATLADDSVLVRELGVNAQSAESPITPESDRGLGERMIIAPALIYPELDRAFVMHLCHELSKRVKIAVLTPNGDLASDWKKEIGASIFTEHSFSTGVSQLKDPKSSTRCAVFVQRYDGVDLADDACRVLVIDGMPFGESLIDRYDGSLMSTPGGVRNKVIYRIEQGMGRAVRSHADYAVVLLVGHELASFVGRKDILSTFTQDTRNQLKLSLEIAENLRKTESSDPANAVTKTILQCLDRNEGWKKFYNQRVRTQGRIIPVVDKNGINLASAERISYNFVRGRNAVDAKRTLSQAVANYISNDMERGLYLQKIAKIAFDYDEAEGFAIQQSAYNLNRSTSLPPAIIRRPLQPGNKTHAELVREHFQTFDNPNGAIAELHKLKINIDYSNNYKIVEAALSELGKILGAQVSRPDNEFHIGPDNLWLYGDLNIILEAKNENQKTLHKKDAGQLMQSIAWFNENYPNRNGELLPIIAAKVVKVDFDATFGKEVRVLREDGVKKIIDNLISFYMKLVEQGPIFATTENIAELLNTYKLTPQYIKGYLDKLE